MSISVLIPVKRPEPHLAAVRGRIEEIQRSNSSLILEILEDDTPGLHVARRNLINRALAPYCLNLDADNLVPRKYPAQALHVFKTHLRIGAVSINFEVDPLPHLPFGCSLWPTSLLKRLYSWPGRAACERCECVTSWLRLIEEGWILATLPLTVKHKPKSGYSHIPTERPKS